MTRLRKADIEDIGAGLFRHDDYLASVTGLPLAALARKAAGCDMVDEPGTAFCVVPVSTGRGIIPRFTETVRDILVHIGFHALLSPEKDADGLLYARRSGAAVTLWADDRQFVAELANGERIDNTDATARGYVTGLDLMAGRVSGRPVLLLGCGPLGQAAADLLLALGARLAVFDPVTERAETVARRVAGGCSPSLEGGLLGHELILDATNAPGIIDERHLSSRTCVSAPGMPCGATPAARKRLADRLLHDPRQIGVATLAFMAHKRHTAGSNR